MYMSNIFIETENRVSCVLLFSFFSFFFHIEISSIVGSHSLCRTFAKVEQTRTSKPAQRSIARKIRPLVQNYMIYIYYNTCIYDHHSGINQPVCRARGRVHTQAHVHIYIYRRMAETPQTHRHVVFFTLYS